MNSKLKTSKFAISSTYLRVLIVIVLFFSTFQTVSAKQKLKSIESIPFDMIGTYVVVKVKVNESSSLNLILDSGIRSTLITELMPGDNISLNYSNVKELMGLGGGDRLEAYTSSANTIKIGKIKLESKTVLVLKEDVFNLSKHTGSKINGLIGIDFFQDYIVDINYTTRRIKFYKQTDTFEAPEEYQKTPLYIEGQKAYLQLSVLESDSTRKDVKMLMDTGAELTAWFQTFKKESVKVPSKGVRGTVGQGLNGEIKGKFARMPEICLGKNCLSDAVVSFVDSASIAEIVANSDRDGTIGSQFLSRFNYIVDYQQKQFYFKPNYTFNKKFSYNVAGIEVSQILPMVPQTEVMYIWENSPAALAGVKVGDQLFDIDGNKAFTMSISELKKIFETPSRRPLNLTVIRNNEQITFKLDMNSKL